LIVYSKSKISVNHNKYKHLFWWFIIAWKCGVAHME